jgi:hypothetical protein
MNILDSRTVSRTPEGLDTLVQRFYTAFPRGWPGAALFVMRVIIALILLVQASYYLREPDASPAALASGLAAGVAAGFLLIGFLTPVVASAAALGALGIWLSLLPACRPTLFDSKTPSVLALTILLAIVCLGPGTFSVDARMFGRREIIFPPSVCR